MLAALDRLPSRPSRAFTARRSPAARGWWRLRIAIGTPQAKFCFSEAKLGLSPATISPYVMRAIGERAARRYFLTAEVFDAAEAAASACYPRVFPPTSSIRALKRSSSTSLLAEAKRTQKSRADPRRRRAGRGRGAGRGPPPAHRRDPRLARRQGGHRLVPREAQAVLGAGKRLTCFGKILIANRGETRVPGDPHGAGARGSQRRGVFRRRPQRAPRQASRRSAAQSAAGRSRKLLEWRGDSCRGARIRRGGDSPGLTGSSRRTRHSRRPAGAPSCLHRAEPGCDCPRWGTNRPPSA